MTRQRREADAALFSELHRKLHSQVRAEPAGRLLCTLRSVVLGPERVRRCQARARRPLCPVSCARTMSAALFADRFGSSVRLGGLGFIALSLSFRL